MAKYAVICASNQNRSMEAHNVLSKKGFDVSSYGTGTMVRLPGPSITQPNIYPFGTPYEDVYQELKAKNEQLYTQNGLLTMLDRNRKVKQAPQRWHENLDMYDVIITCEERCFDAVVEDLLNRGQNYNTSTHVINVEIKDNHEDALLGGRAILQLCQMIEASSDIDADMAGIIEQFTERNKTHPILHTVAYF
ncbi:RNA polymerase II subunit A C-terminal domain phosphatase SSU72 [Radiomyces spectabilis]|uniref:RNA polymerase II subunit A C-terminal domain phosphatase SSU72 n=1 Tax=Radiomyces spectabilis TaxID=64574 RepID=UPI002220B502|nr:RNA polymerase II subunit A C-terminal domain phosphatase SSU72 [Radiomyces spectabilis]KAI8376183.1 RNA polymerase II subunit A C-terminal domain phosphatase SSU72 [Radiomyces spectabilis]